MLCDERAAGIPLVQMAEFDSEEGGLEFIDAAVIALNFVVVADSRTVIPQNADFVGESGIIRGDRPGFAESAKVLARIETVTFKIGEPSDAAAFIARPVGLGIIYDKFQAVFADDFIN